MDFNELVDAVKSGKINEYQLYNLDVDPEEFESCKYYIDHPNDTIDKQQKLHFVALDIEVYTFNKGQIQTFGTGEYPINCVTLYSSKRDELVTFFLQMSNIRISADFEQLIRDKLQEDNVEKPWTLHIYTNELQMLKDIWQYIHEDDPAIITGWNADKFDIPYIYKRLNYLTHDVNQTAKIMSKFGVVTETKYGNDNIDDMPIVKIVEYSIADMMYLYKPRDEGGLNYGKKQASYSLDWVANAELSKRKINVKDEGLSLDSVYEKEPVMFTFYNVIDTDLVRELWQTLDIANLHNVIRRLMKAPFDYSLRGAAVYFDTFVLYKLLPNLKLPRYKLTTEIAQNISVKEQEKISLPVGGLLKNKKMTSSKKKEFEYKPITSNEYIKYLSKYPGAYVKFPPKKKIFSEKQDGIIADLDASSLYPSMIVQHNISFDTYFGRVIDPLVYKSISVIDQLIKEGQGSKLYEQFKVAIRDMLHQHVDEHSYQNKTNAIVTLYMMIMYNLNKLISAKKVSAKLFHPSSFEEYRLLRINYIPLLDLLTEIHPQTREYNSFAYEYLLLDSLQPGTMKDGIVYVIENDMQPNMQIVPVNKNKFENYLKEKEISITLSGSLFFIHQKQLSLFTKFLLEMKELRNEFERRRDEFEPGSDQYKKWDMDQLSVKRTMNTTYGLYGMSGFRYSSSQLAKAITTQGRMTLKIAQIVAEKYFAESTSTIQ